MSKSETLSHINPNTSTCDNLSENHEEPRHIQMLPKDQLKPDEIEDAADFVVSEAFNLPFFKTFSKNSLKEGVTETYDLVDGGTASVKAQETNLGKELRVRTEKGFVDISNKGKLSMVDVKFYDEDGQEIVYKQSEEESLGLALDFLNEIDEQIIPEGLVEMRDGEEMYLQNSF